MNLLHFDQVYGGALCCIWQDEMRFFPDKASAERWAARQGFKAVFAESEPIEPMYMYGVTGEEQE